MKKPVVDYRKFRLNKLNTPEFSHLKLLGGWIVYFVLFFLTENLIPVEDCTPIHCFLDDIIPFNEFFLIPYFGWYLLIVFSLGYFLLYNVDNFKRLQKFIIVTQIAAMLIYILLPSRQDLRPEIFPRDNFLTDAVKFLYSVDTNTGVCPSLHCAYSIGIASVWFKEKSAYSWWKWTNLFLCLLVCVSTTFVKQHSAVDFFAALPICLLAEYIACRDYYNGRKKENLRKS